MTIYYIVCCIVIAKHSLRDLVTPITVANSIFAFYGHISCRIRKIARQTVHLLDVNYSLLLKHTLRALQQMFR